MSEKEAQYISIHIGLALGMSNKLFYCSQGLDNHCIFEICFDKRKPHKSQKSFGIRCCSNIVNNTISTCFDCLNTNEIEKESSSMTKFQYFCHWPINVWLSPFDLGITVSY